MKCFWIALGITTVAAGSPPAAARSAAGTVLTVEALGWASTTRSARVRTATEVYQTARRRDRLGKIARGTRLTWRRIVATGDRCKAWFEIEPRGWVCGRDLEPSDAVPQPVAPAAGGDSRLLCAMSGQAAVCGGQAGGLPRRGHADVLGSSDVFDTVAEIQAGTPARRVPDATFVRVKSGKLVIDGEKYQKTDQGWIAADKLRPLVASDFGGIDVVATPPPSWPFAWIAPHKEGRTVAVRTIASRRGEKVRELEGRAIVPVLDTSTGFAQIGAGEWVAIDDLRFVALAAPPTGVSADERWIDVDLDQQVLVAYQGATPVYATLISSGKSRSGTPTGIYRISKKVTMTRMRMEHPTTSRVLWDVADVPYAMTFRKHFALHGAYWHDGFGMPRSNGCVNLSPRDARWIYHWTTPEASQGWTMVEVAEDAGTVIRIRSHHDPEPAWKDFAGKPRKGARGGKADKVARR